MVGTFPRRWFVLLWRDLAPDLSGPVKDRNGIESLLVGSSAPKDYHLIGGGVVVDGAVRAVGWTLSSGSNFLPSAFGSVVAPEVIHVVGVYIILSVPAYPPKKIT